MRKRVYPDTNVALHFKRFDEVDWLTLAGATEVDLAIALSVVEELDTKKWEAGRAVKQRARDLGAWLGRLADGEFIRKGVRVVFEVQESELSVDFRAERLSERSADDRLIAAMIAAARDGNTPVVAVTADLGLRRKLTARGLAVLEPLDSDRRELERDEVVDENRRLKSRIAQLEGASAALELAFEDGTGKTTCELPVCRRLEESEIERIVRRERFRLGEVQALPAAVRAAQQAMQARTPIPLERYLPDLRAWLREFSDSQSRRSLTFPIGFRLKNVGAGAAEETDIILSVPGRETSIGPSRFIPRCRRRPSSRTTTNPFRVLEEMNATADEEIGAGPLDRGVVVEHELGDENAVRISVGTLKHNDALSLGVACWFEAIEDVRPFSIAYRLLSTTQREPVVGQLRFEVTAAAVTLDIPEDDEE